MSTQISKRLLLSKGALAAGAGVGALALLAPQRASADTPFSSFAFPATGAPTSRTMPNRLAEVKNVKDYGAIGNGVADDTAAIQATLNAAYGSPSAPHGGNSGVHSNAAVFFPAGIYRITSALLLRSVRGAHIFGSGRFSTKIVNTTSGGTVFRTNGCDYSRFERMQLTVIGAGSVGFDLEWDGTGTCALQSNTFSDMFFEGGAYGLRIGETGQMGSENVIHNCYFANCTVAGLATKNYNALQQSVIGGNFANCAIGIWVWSGSVNLISGVGFQFQTDSDIVVSNSAEATYSISGCRTESANFGRFHAGVGVHLSGCGQVNTPAGVFAFIEAGAPGLPGSLVIDSCRSVNGIITGNGHLYIRGSSFGNAGYLGSFNGTVKQNI